MKTFLANILPRLQQYSQTLDKKEVLIDQPWVNVDEALNKTHYIFRRDGALIVSLNGDAITGKWEYISGARSLLVDAGNKKLLLNHGFVDSAVLILKKDGFLESPFVLVNERIVPDLDVEKYLQTLLKANLYIRSVEMEDGIVFDFSDPYQAGLEIGNEVSTNGNIPDDGVYKSSTNNKNYEVKNGKVILIFHRIYSKTDRGVLEYHYNFLSSPIGSLAFVNANSASDGKYNVLEGEIKYFLVQDGKIKKIKHKPTIWPYLVLLYIAIIVVAIIVFSRHN